MKQSARAVLTAAATAAATGCITPVAPPPDNLPGEVIVYETIPGPWCGRCDTLKITAAADGRVWVERGWWAGDYKDWREKRQMLSVTPERIAAFSAALDPHRPDGELLLVSDGCTTLFTHMEERIVSWRGPQGEDKLQYNFGCDPDTRAGLRNDLRAAPSLLGIAAPTYIGISTSRIR